MGSNPSARPGRGSRSWRATVALVAAALAAHGAACHEQRSDAEREEASLATVLARDRAAAWFAAGRLEEAARALAPLLAEPGTAPQDLLRAANVELARARLDAAAPLVARARSALPRDPAVHWCSYRLARARGDLLAALRHAERAHELAPGDFPTELVLAGLQAELGRHEQAEDHYRALLERAHTRGGRWLAGALRGYAGLLAGQGKSGEAERYREECDRLRAAGIEEPEPAALERGSFGGVPPAQPGPVEDDAAWQALLLDASEREGQRLVPSQRTTLEGVRGLLCLDVEDGAGDPGALCARLACAPQEVIAFGPGGVRRLRFEDGRMRVAETILEEGASLVVALDLRSQEPSLELSLRSSTIELLAATDAGLVLLERADGAWRRAQDRPLIGPDFALHDLAPVDFDHDGDLDLLAAGPRGVRLLRNDGARQGGAFVDAALEAGLPVETGLAWCAVEDLDHDGDVDLVLGGADGALFVASNERSGRFSDATEALPAALRRGPAPLLFDLVPDGRPDLLVAGPEVSILASAAGGGWSERSAGAGARSALAPHSVRVHDLFHAGRPLCLWPEAERGLMALAPEGETRSAQALHDGSELAPLQFVLADVDGDGTSDVVETDGRSLRVLLVRGAGAALRLGLRGTADNQRGVGAIVELRAGPLYRRVLARGEPIEIGLGRARTLDVLRVTWPDGRVQTELDLSVPGCYRLRQPSARSGS